ncbi:hypothetical protein [Marinibactrum halimedae]|uniref:Uncharacterized protein n=1 Tax=Marinibactrum halimedae TaxID=1444977 RepID=A0AA37T3N0_9GAMM|nr:hypothetical protein [Marinibactrum halimedae]MCD9457956.1 hypothetical protein [Marinibactrum halimedae]GLS26213.1 hypothetical protein GCM10007877_19280 [Marinibactrum halimedae]
MDTFRYTQHFLVLWLTLFSFSVFAQSELTRLRSDLSSVDSAIEASESKLQQHNNSVSRMTTEEDQIVTEYETVSADLQRVLKEAEDPNNEKAHREAMIISVRFNRIDGKYERFFERKQKVLEKIDTLELDIAKLQGRKSELLARIAAAKQRAEVASSQQANVPAANEAESPSPSSGAPSSATVSSQDAKATTATTASASQPLEGTEQANTTSAKKTSEVTKNTNDTVVAAVDSTEADWPTVGEKQASAVQFAQRELARLTGKEPGKSRLGRVKVRSSRLGKHALTYLGDNIYTGVFELANGEYTFSVFSKKFTFSLPEEAEQGQYRLIYDVDSISNPKVYLFPVSWVK